MVQNATNQFAADDDIRYAPQDNMAFEIEQAAFDVYKVWLWDSKKIQQQKSEDRTNDIAKIFLYQRRHKGARQT